MCFHKMMMMLVVPRSRSRQAGGGGGAAPEDEAGPPGVASVQGAGDAADDYYTPTHTPRPSDSDGGSRSRSSLVLQAIAQEDLRRHKMARFGFGLGGHTKVTQQDELLPPAMPDPDGRDLEAHRDWDEHGAPAAQAQQLPSHRHTPILLLKASSESDTTTATGGVAIGDGQKTLLLGLPRLHRDASISVLLQEVKDRVQRELALHIATATGGDRIKAPTWAILPPLQQQVTKHKQDRGNKRLFRSESFRAFRSDRKRTPAAAAAATRHASHGDGDGDGAAAHIPSSETADNADDEEEEEESLTDASLSVLRPGVTDGQSFRSECLTLTTTKHRDDAAPSPRLLFRSFSAPESGFAFSIGSLFSSKHHEASEPAAAAAVTMTSKSVVSAAGFSSFIRGTVSSLRRHGFSSRRKLMMFRRKTHWSWSNNNKTASLGAGEIHIHPAKMEMEMEMPICTPTPPCHETINLFKVAQANLSELPPSPVSPLEVAAGQNSRHLFSDLHFTLPPELSPKCLSELEPPATASESSFRTDITAVETACSRDKAYITELLIAAGLYDDDDDGPSSSANARVDSMARPMPICDDVFEDVEDMYYYRGDYIVGSGMHDDRRMLFDLANEALQSLVVAESSRGGCASSLRQWVVDSTGVARGKKLVDDVWQQVQALKKNPQQAQEMQTIDGMVAYEVRRSVWAEVLYEDVYVVGRKIERAIFDELIEDFFLHALEVFI
ncbi:hypothetical protein BDA96_10G353600 [Sorghum bicolor]|nr:hypothetical protein BDA96_10G353600 [Sorghum bicolor]